MPDLDKVFTGSICRLYESHLVPLIFEPYALDIQKKIIGLHASRILEVAAGTGVVTRAMATVVDDEATIVATDLNQAMLDEASAGLSPKYVGQVFAKLAEIRHSGIAILMVEQNAKAALAFADRAIILAEGRTAHQGKAADIASDPVIRQLYLGLAPARGAA